MFTRYTYSTHSTRAKANDALESYFASGEVSEGERPLIEKRGARYAVTLTDR